MTAEDLAAYGEALAAGELFQDPDSLAQMLTFNENALVLGGAPFGLGLMDFGNGYWGHEGQTAGFQSLWYTNPDEGITVVGLTNSAAYTAFSFLNVHQHSQRQRPATLPIDYPAAACRSGPGTPVIRLAVEAGCFRIRRD